MASKYQNHIDSFNFKQESGVTDGLIYDRKCTNLGCLAIFVAFLGAMVGISFYSFTKGNIHALVGPIDGNGHICGTDSGDFKSYRSLYFVDPRGDSLPQIQRNAVCVKECPDGKKPVDCKPTTEYPNCDAIPVQFTYDSVNFIGYCFPRNPELIPGWTNIESKLKDGNVGKFVNDVKTSANSLIICTVLALVFSILYLYMMSIFPTQLAYLAVLIVEACFVAGIGLCFVHLKTANSD